MSNDYSRLIKMFSTEDGRRLFGDLAKAVMEALEAFGNLPAQPVILSDTHTGVERLRQYLNLLSSSDDPEWRAQGDFMLGMTIHELGRYLRTRELHLTPKPLRIPTKGKPGQKVSPAYLAAWEQIQTGTTPAIAYQAHLKSAGQRHDKETRKKFDQAMRRLNKKHGLSTQ